MQPLVSIVIPAFNAQSFIEDTISSVLSQSYKFVELIVIDDGSTDRTKEKIETFTKEHPNVHYFYQKNAGVSAARNKGLGLARGKYVVFLDADDMLEPDFVKKRILFLDNHPYYSACCSSVIVIDENSKPQSIYHIGAHDNFVSQILGYKSTYSSCPSNYLFAREILIKNNLKFDIHLSSSADRFFLIEISRYIKIGLIFNDFSARLKYRIHPLSMSRSVSFALVNDNRIFSRNILALSYLSARQKNLFRFKAFYMLAGGFLQLKKYNLAFLYATKSAFYNPIKFIKQLCAG